LCLWEGTVVEVKHTLPHSVTRFLDIISMIVKKVIRIVPLVRNGSRG
jgi:hypothetical protein